MIYLRWLSKRYVRLWTCFPPIFVNACQYLFHVLFHVRFQFTFFLIANLVFSAKFLNSLNWFIFLINKKSFHLMLWNIDFHIQKWRSFILLRMRWWLLSSNLTASINTWSSRCCVWPFNLILLGLFFQLTILTSGRTSSL